MGRNKLLLDVGGVTMVRRAAVTAVAAGLSPVVVVTGNESELVQRALDGLPCSCVVNPDFTGPTSGSLHAGLRSLGGDVDAAVVLLADMIRISDAMLTAVCNANHESGAPLTVSRYGDVLAPPLLFRRALWPELLAWHGEGCGKAVVNRHRAEAEIVDWPIDLLRDVDTPDDYRDLVSQ